MKCRREQFGSRLRTLWLSGLAFVAPPFKAASWSFLRFESDAICSSKGLGPCSGAAENAAVALRALSASSAEEKSTTGGEKV